MAGGPNDSRRDETWYGSQGTFHTNGAPANINLDFGVIVGHVFSPIHLATPMDAESTNPTVRGDYAPHYSQPPYVPQNVDDWHHNSSVEVSALHFTYNRFQALNGRINASGYTDRYGNVVAVNPGAACSPGSDCVPFEFTNVPVGNAGFRDAEYESSTGRPSQVINYDVINPATGNSLIVWPN